MASLFTYQQQTQRFLWDVTQQTFNPNDLKDWINQARGQLAGDSESIRVMGTLTTSPSVRVYPFSAISLTGSTGVQGVLNVRIIWYTSGSGQKVITSRPFEWFSLYEMNELVPPVGPPQTWAQFGQGVNGTIYISPLPDISYTQPVDCVCYPVPLVDNTTVEAIPYLWTDAVPYFAAYLALLSPGSGSKNDAAKEMLTLYQEFVARARNSATPSVLPGNFAQSGAPQQQQRPSP